MRARALAFKFASGTQGDAHETPGARYHGTARQCFLPCDAAGCEALALLRAAFARGLTFRIGTSVTTGQPHQTVWVSDSR